MVAERAQTRSKNRIKFTHHKMTLKWISLFFNKPQLFYYLNLKWVIFWWLHFIQLSTWYELCLGLHITFIEFCVFCKKRFCSATVGAKHVLRHNWHILVSLLDSYHNGNKTSHDFFTWVRFPDDLLLFDDLINTTSLSYLLNIICSI